MMIFLIVLLCIDDCDQILVSVPINYSKSRNFANKKRDVWLSSYIYGA